MYFNKVIQIVLCIIASIIVDLPYLYLNLDLFKKTTFKISGKGYPSNRIYSALLVYVAIACGLIVFVLPKIDTTKTLTIRIQDSLIYGGLFGLVSYGIFDFTTHFMFESWSIYIALMDTIWGGLLCSIVSFIMSYYVSK
jgi:uncharacterized membrane protein